MKPLTRDLTVAAGLAAAVVVSLVVVRVTAAEPVPTPARITTANAAPLPTFSAPVRLPSPPSPRSVSKTGYSSVAPRGHPAAAAGGDTGSFQRCPGGPSARPHPPHRATCFEPTGDGGSPPTTGQPDPTGVRRSRRGRRRLAIGTVLVRLPRRPGRQHPPGSRLRGHPDATRSGSMDPRRPGLGPDHRSTTESRLYRHHRRRRDGCLTTALTRRWSTSGYPGPIRHRNGLPVHTDHGHPHLAARS